MKKTLHLATERGYNDLGWLKSYHSFSFGKYHDDAKMNFGLLRVLNDDHVAPSMGFGTHGHANMEIVSIPLSGALKHKDSTGRDEIINAGDVQIMSAGAGIQHSEHNASGTEPVDFLQIWVFPKLKDIEPRYQQLSFTDEDKHNRFLTVVSPNEADGAVNINQDAWFNMGNFDAGFTTEYQLNDRNNGLYVFVIDGNITVAGEVLSKRDAVGVYDTDGMITFIADTASKLLVIEVPMV